MNINDLDNITPGTPGYALKVRKDEIAAMRKRMVKARSAWKANNLAQWITEAEAALMRDLNNM